MPAAYFAPYSTQLFQERGIGLAKWWLGLLTEEEAKSFERDDAVQGLDAVTRRRLWKARVTEEEGFVGRHPKHSEFEPLPASPDFLAAGLLSTPRPTGPKQVLWLREPDSVLVLHSDRLDHKGRLRLARVRGPDGVVAWDTALPLSVLQSVMPGKKSLVLFGYEYAAREGAPLDPGKPDLERLVAVDLATSAVHTHKQEEIRTHAAAPAQGRL